MSKKTHAFFEQLKSGQEPSLVETIREAAAQLWDAAKPMFDHGRAEVAAALFSGNAHVVYGWGGSGQQQVQQPEVPNTPEVQRENEEREM
jgi:hypothetical protein